MVERMLFVGVFENFVPPIRYGNEILNLILNLFLASDHLFTCRRYVYFTDTSPMTFNALPDELRDPTVNTTTFRRLLKTHFSRAIYTSSALEVKT